MMEAQQHSAGNEQMLAQMAERTEQAMDMLGRSLVGKMEGLLASQQRSIAENESGMLQKINQMMQKQGEANSDSFSNTLQAKFDMTQAQHGFPSGIIRQVWNGAERISVAPAPG